MAALTRRPDAGQCSRMDLTDITYRVTFQVTSPDGERTETKFSTMLRIVDLNGQFFASNANVHEPVQGRGTNPDLAMLDYLRQVFNHKDT
jgi:hypothetical protein